MPTCICKYMYLIYMHVYMYICSIELWVHDLI